MDERRTIYIGVDVFYASAERKDHPELCGKPLAAGHVEERGVMAAISHEARQYGMRPVMPSQKAKRSCPQLIFIPGRVDIYKSVSRRIHEILHERTDLIKPFLLDEAFLDVIENKQGILSVVDIVRVIKQRTREEPNLVVSTGASYNKFLAKIASDFRRPDGLYTIHPDQALDFIAHLPTGSSWGIGSITAQRMHLLSIRNSPQLRGRSSKALVRQFGKVELLYCDFARGIDLRPVEVVWIRKLISYGHTSEENTHVKPAMITEFYYVVMKLVEWLQRKDSRGKTLTLKIRFHDFNQIIRSMTQTQELTSLEGTLPFVKQLLKGVEYEQHPIRLIGLPVPNPREEIDERRRVWE